MQLETMQHDDVMVITLAEDRLDAAIALDFKDTMRDLTVNSTGRVVLDMERVRFLDSSGLGAVIGSMKQLGQNRKLELAGLNPAVEKVFRLTRMDSIFTIHQNISFVLGTDTDTGAEPSRGQAHAY